MPRNRYHEYTGPTAAVSAPTTPRTPGYYVILNGTSAYIDCGSGSTLDNLCAAPVTIDAWVRLHTADAAYNREIACKGGEETGWEWFVQAGASKSGTSVQVVADILSARSGETVASSGFTVNAWHHIVWTCDDTDERTIYLAIDGAWVTSYSEQQVGIGDLVSDAGDKLIIGAFSDLGASTFFDGDISWFRISDALRWTPGEDFLPPSLWLPPAVDSDTVELWRMNEGTGTSLAAAVTSANAGTGTDIAWGEF